MGCGSGSYGIAVNKIWLAMRMPCAGETFNLEGFKVEVTPAHVVITGKEGESFEPVYAWLQEKCNVDLRKKCTPMTIVGKQ